MDNLTEENFLLFAAKHYISTHYSTFEFNSDLKRITYIKRLLKKYKKSDELAERLILNHLILLYNVFGPTLAVNKMVFLKIDPEYYSALKTFLVYLNRMSVEIEINNSKIISSDIQIDVKIANILRQL
jgi:hypothetical protein